MNCGDPFETERDISKLNTRVTARMMKANVLTIVVNSVPAIRTNQISKNIAHINIRFSAPNVMTTHPVWRRSAGLSRVAKPCARMTCCAISRELQAPSISGKLTDNESRESGVCKARYPRPKSFASGDKNIACILVPRAHVSMFVAYAKS